MNKQQVTEPRGVAEGPIGEDYDFVGCAMLKLQRDLPTGKHECSSLAIATASWRAKRKRRPVLLKDLHPGDDGILDVG